MAERGCLAMTPGQALDDTISQLNIDFTQCHGFKAWAQLPSALNEFSEDARFLDCINTNYTVQDVWLKRNG